ncbi:uncharacterized protein ACLA_040430 [Aspergillus clavatus NRRL 1]|uniref:Uncharacterized protein n=1 Tax=Aspergillus clavatus (strain ATCC 1007 / CBS 513.65 / DSM 816 / NCTC 3887 / NRRL 1 / QM 1276 / 107) TaxID=344612 RepID=A1CL03_ASPCL|nr:uncharacterized protein ACLA_040430 [Aspergillus clavatus NRRL 1]EAW09827.1 conserved hypothetical protein [Aspergillus clavatus NRRL 1]
MAKADLELQKIMGTLTHIYRSNTDHSTGITHKPYGVDWINLERTLYRLLVLQGKVRNGDKVPEDPWEVFLREFTPLSIQRPAGTRQPSTPYFPSSILRSSVEGQQQRQQRDHEQHVRFEVPAVRRSGEERRHSGPIPRFFSCG